MNHQLVLKVAEDFRKEAQKSLEKIPEALAANDTHNAQIYAGEYYAWGQAADLLKTKVDLYLKEQFNAS